MIQAALTTIAAGEPAGGAALDQVVIATLAATLAFSVLAWLCSGHRSGRLPYLRRAAALSERVSGLPGWAALPSGISAVSLLVALVGMYWDISLHIGVGRDDGPLANPAHYLILVGLFGILAAGMLAIFLPEERPGPAAVRIAGDWYAPVGGILVTACGTFALIGFPLDDVWHRLFGQDVTLWGPTHLMLIGGAGMTLIGLAVLLVEGMRARGAGFANDIPMLVRMRRTGLMGGLLIGLSTFQAEFDFGVPQFRFVLEPVMLAIAASIALVCARLWIGRGGALAATVFFLVVRGGLSLLVGPILGEPTPHLPLYLAEAVCVELAALALARRSASRWPDPLALGALSGLLIGTVGFAAEWGWSRIAMPLPWTADLLPEGVILATVAGVAGGLLGAILGSALRGELRPGPFTRTLSLGSLAAIMVVFAIGLPTTAPEALSATITLDDGTRAPEDEAAATVRFDPPDAADDAAWLTVTAWQGGGLVLDRLEPTGGGAYRTTGSIPVGGDWKTLVRLHRGDQVLGVPIYLPRDTAIPAPPVPARASVTRPLTSDHRILQREQKQGVPQWLDAVAHLVVLAIALTLLAVIGGGVGRLGRTAGQPPERTQAAAKSLRPIGASS
jgi:hypothetical protein